MKNFIYENHKISVPYDPRMIQCTSTMPGSTWQKDTAKELAPSGAEKPGKEFAGS